MSAGSYCIFLPRNSRSISFRKPSIWNPSTFVQYDWRIHKSLLFNLGLRYDVFTAETEQHSNIANLNLATPQLIVGGTGGVQTQVRQHFARIPDKDPRPRLPIRPCPSEFLLFVAYMTLPETLGHYLGVTKVFVATPIKDLMQYTFEPIVTNVDSLDSESAGFSQV